MELNSLNVRTPFTASNATFALNSSVCCFRFATTITPPLLDNTTPSQSQLNYLSKKRGELHNIHEEALRRLDLHFGQVAESKDIIAPWQATVMGL
jgi:hypothetical protein